MCFIPCYGFKEREKLSKRSGPACLKSYSFLSTPLFFKRLLSGASPLIAKGKTNLLEEPTCYSHSSARLSTRFSVSPKEGRYKLPFTHTQKAQSPGLPWLQPACLFPQLLLPSCPTSIIYSEQPQMRFLLSTKCPGLLPLVEDGP